MKWAITTRLFKLILAAGIAMVTLPVFLANAATKISVKTSYYSVRGNSPGSLAAYMIRNGPHGDSGRAMGTTTANIKQHMELQTKGRGCSIRRHRLEVAITMRVPKLAKGLKLSASTRSLFNGLAAYVRNHENHHKSVFIKCARRIDLKVSAVRRSQSCSAVRAQIKRIFDAENRRCNGIHSAFDAREAVRVRNLPFIRKAMGPQRTVRRKATKRRAVATGRKASLLTGRELK